MRFFLILLLISVNANSADFQSKTPTKIIELNEKTLRQNVWPGMTIKQGMQILGEPEEAMPVMASCQTFNKSEGDPAVRYGIYWLIPAVDGHQIKCIVNQRGIQTKKGHICDCRTVIKKYVLEVQN